MDDVTVCAACGVETAPVGTELTGADTTCPICADERQFVPASGQEWTTRSALEASGHSIEIAEVEPGLHSLRTAPRTGIGQTCYLAQCGEAGTLLFDVPPYIDETAVRAVAHLGGISAIVASHPHMYGMQLEWSAAFDHAPVYVSRRDSDWVQRPGRAITLFDEEIEPLAGARIRQVGGHFPGSSVALWTSPDDGALVMLGGDTISPVARRGWVTFMRSFPNYLPLSAAVVRRMAAAVADEPVERIYGNFGQKLLAGGAQAIAQSAERYAAWVSGECDHLT